jgi:hypothetical protein
MSLFMRRIFNTAAAASATGAVVVGNTVIHETVQNEPRHEAPHPLRALLAHDFDRADPDGAYLLVDDDKGSLPVVNITDLNPSARDVECGLEVVRENPGMVMGCLPQTMRDSHMSGSIPDLMKDPRFVAHIHGSFARHVAIKGPEKRDTLSAAEEQLTADALWRILCAEFFCSCCQDVLAAPVVLKCTHSFCGSCITECYNRCVQCDELPGLNCVVCQCPECRAPVQGQEWAYERAYDDVIMKRVSEVPNCQMKTDYLERRNGFLESEKARKAADAQAKSKPLPRSIERMFSTDGGHNTTSEGRREAEEGRWVGGSFITAVEEMQIIPIVVALVAAVLMAVAYHKRGA